MESRGRAGVTVKGSVRPARVDAAFVTVPSK